MAHGSIVIELQTLASDSTSKVSDVLRKALLLSTKLGVGDFKQWVETELRGYKDGSVAAPSYRIIRAQIKAWNPYRGYIKVQIEDSATEERYCRTTVNNALPELEEMAKVDDDGSIVQKLPPEHSAVGSTGMGVTFDTYRIISRSQVVGIIEAVRTMILEWALKLEVEGILGNGMTFSEADKKRAAESPGIHIRNFHGVLGDVTAQNLQIGEYASIHGQLKDAGISQEQRNELENILDQLKTAEGAEKRKTIIQRGMDWLGRNGKNLGALVEVIRPWFH